MPKAQSVKDQRRTAEEDALVAARKKGPNPLQLPTSDRDLRACRRCHRILTTTQFVQEGCLSCAQAKGRQVPTRIPRAKLEEETTTQNFGHVGIYDSNASWIARLIGVSGQGAGVYAARVLGSKRGQDEEPAAAAVGQRKVGGDAKTKK